MAFADLFRGLAPQPGEGEVNLVDALSKVASGGTFIDVRSRSDYEKAHIPGSKLVDLAGLQTDALTAIWGGDPLAETDKPLVVVSATPKHAGAIAHLLRDKGFDAFALAGGLMAWVADGQPLVPGPPR